MQSVILTTLFPTQKIFLLEKRKEHVRNHGLRIWHSTIESIQSILTSISSKIKKNLGELQEENVEEKIYFPKILSNIKMTLIFLKTKFLDAPGFLGPFISTKKISNILQEFALEIGEGNKKDLSLKENKFQIKQGKQYEFKFDYLNEIEKENVSLEEEKNVKEEISIEEIIFIENKEFIKEKESNIKLEEEEKEKLDFTEVKEIIKNSSIIFSAEGSHSSIRKFIIGEEFPNETVIQYLIEIKLHVKPEIELKNIDEENIEKVEIKKTSENLSTFKKVKNSKMSSISSSSELLSDAVSYMITPLITTGKVHVWNKGKDGTATLHILVEKEVFDAMTSKKNSKGNMGGFANPYTRIRQLPYEADTRKLIKNGLTDVIGLDNFDHDSLKITTIPMKIYFSKELLKIENEKLFILVGDSACGLIFIEGANNAIHTGAHYGEGLIDFFLNQKLTNEQLKSFKFDKSNEIPEELMNSYEKIKLRYHEAENRIKLKKKAIEYGEKFAYTSHVVTSVSKKKSKMDDEETFHEIHTSSKYSTILKSIDDELDKISIDETFKSSIHLFDSFVNDLEQEVNHIEENSKNTISEEKLKKLLKETEDFIKFLLSNEKEKNLQKIEEFQKFNTKLTLKETTTLLVFTSHLPSNLTQKMNNLINFLLLLLKK